MLLHPAVRCTHTAGRESHYILYMTALVAVRRLVLQVQQSISNTSSQLPPPPPLLQHCCRARALVQCLFSSCTSCVDSWILPTAVLPMVAPPMASRVDVGLVLQADRQARAACSVW